MPEKPIVKIKKIMYNIIYEKESADAKGAGYRTKNIACGKAHIL